jgi:hypothetical protein
MCPNPTIFQKPQTVNLVCVGGRDCYFANPRFTGMRETSWLGAKNVLQSTPLVTWKQTGTREAFNAEKANTGTVRQRGLGC